jgi:GTP-binding protein EngB required for normal cell division
MMIRSNSIMFDDILKRYTSEASANRRGERNNTPAPTTPDQSVERQQTPLPNDLSEQIEPWLAQVANLAEAYHVQSVTTALRSLREHWNIPGFRLAFVGEFSRGKSTLINRILNRTLLPVAVLPTTACITSIMHGEEDHLSVNFLDGHQEIRPLEASSWHDLIADRQAEKDREIETTVRVSLKHPWLHEIGIEMIDTPGAGDTNDQGTAHILQVLSQCDATIILVSAAAPLSLTEKMFIEQEILGRHIPQLLVVVSKLDTIPLPQRHDVLATISERLKHISPNIPVLSVHKVDADENEGDPLEAIRSQIAGMAVRSDRQLWRSRQVAGRLADYLKQLMEIGQQVLAEQALDQAQREAEHKKAHAATQAEAARWETIKLRFQQRRLQVDQEFCQQLQVSGDHIVQLLVSDLSQSNDPKIWWEQQFPFLLHHELLLLARASSTFFMNILAQDVEVLHGEVSRTFAAGLTRNVPNVTEVPEPLPVVPDLVLADEGQYLLLSRLGSSAAVIIGYLLVGPIGSAITLALGITSDRMLKRAIEDQRSQVKGEVFNCVSRTLQEYTQLLSRRLQGLYEEVAQGIEDEQQTWLAAHEEVLKLAIEASVESISWPRLIEQASSLRTHILNALQQ